MDNDKTYCGDDFSIFTNIEHCFTPETNTMPYFNYFSKNDTLIFVDDKNEKKSAINYMLFITASSHVFVIHPSVSVQMMPSAPNNSGPRPRDENRIPIENTRKILENCKNLEIKVLVCVL